MNTLVIHPQDASTDFLKPIYNNIKNKIVLTKGISKPNLIRLIKRYDRIIMMGHGSPGGLFAINWGKIHGYIIDDEMAKFLNEKENCFYIWCNADVFVDRHKLRGFYTGMFISEVGEANWFDIKTTQDVVDQSNNTFAEIVSRHNSEPISEMYKSVLQEYGELAETNEIAKYNHERLYIRP